MSKLTHRGLTARAVSQNPITHRSALSLAIAATLYGAVGLSSAAFAQEEAAMLEEVVVTGIRAGIENAMEVKKDSGSIVEAISAEDIGKLPDTSIAESISRLPGLTSQRAEGRASAISLRGTDPGFATTLMNGREQVSTGDNRSIEYDQYPSELINQVVVYKTPDSGLIGQGLAGTIDLRTVRPLDYGRQAIVLNLRGEQNDGNDLGADSDDQGYRASFSYIDQFADGTVGLAFGYARLDSPINTAGFGTYEPINTDRRSDEIGCSGDSNGTGCFRDPGLPAGTYSTGGMKVRADMGSTVRDGFMAALQFKPGDTYSGILDVYYSTMEQTDNARSLEVNLGGYPAPCCDGTFPLGTTFGYSNTTIDNDMAVAGTLNTVNPLARNFLFETKDEILAAGFRNEFKLSDTWDLMADISYSKATREQDQFELEAQFLPVDGGEGAPVRIYDTGTYRLRGTDDMPTLSFQRNYADPTLVQVGPTIYGGGYSKIPEVEDELTSVRLDATRTAEMWWFERATFGVNYADRTKDKISPESPLSTIGGQNYQVASQYLLDPTNLGYANAGRALAFDVNGVLGEYYTPIVYGDPTTLNYLAGKYWDVEEKITTVFIRGELNHAISDAVTLKGNVGLQYLYTDQGSSSFIIAAGLPPDERVQTRSDGKSYDDFLPQVNLAFLMPNQQAIRVGFAREMARPRMDELRATEESGYDLTRSPARPSGSGGNAQLDPWRAWAFDLSYERYFEDNKGYVSVAGFYKDLSTYIYRQTDANHDFSDLEALYREADPDYFGPIDPETTGNFTQPVNGSGGYLWGLEFSTTLNFSMFSEALDGFGAILSYSYTESDIEVEGSISSVASTNIPLPGLSQDVWSATLYYEKYGFGARVATRYRSEFIGEVTNFANERGLRYVDPDMITDLQLSYSFESGAMDGLQILFQVNNVTDDPYVAYSEDKKRVIDYQEYGAQYLLGFTYKF